MKKLKKEFGVNVAFNPNKINWIQVLFIALDELIYEMERSYKC